MLVVVIDGSNATTIEIHLEPLRSRDGFEVKPVVRLPVRLHDSDVDRTAFTARFGRGSTVSRSGEPLAKHLKAGVAGAVMSLPGRDAAEWMTAAKEIASAVTAASRRPLFEVGLMTAGEVAVTLDAPDLRRREAERAAIEASKAAAAHAEDLLLRFEDIRRQNPDVPPGKLLMALPADERREALRLMFQGSRMKDQTRLVLAAGVGLWEVADDRVQSLRDIGDLGPIRRLASRTESAGMLLVGSRDGVISVRSTDALESRPLRASLEDGSMLGFSVLDVASSREGPAVIWGAHADLGLEAWSATGETLGTLTNMELASTIAGEMDDAVRVAGLVALDSTSAVLLLRHLERADAWVCRVAALHYEGGHPDLMIEQGALPVESALFLFRRDGDQLLKVNARGGHQVIEADAQGLRVGVDPAATPPAASLSDRSLTAACVFPWLGDIRIAACVEDGPIVVAGPDDDVQIEYRSNHKGFAAIAASAGRLAAVTGDRQRIILWNLDQPD